MTRAIQNITFIRRYLKTIFNDLKNKYPLLNYAKVLSDGAASQFKNKFTILHVIFGAQDFDFNLEWNFFCTSHEKSAADGIGAIVKRGVRNRVLKRNIDVYTAAEFVNCAKTFVKNINVLEVTTNTVSEHSNYLQNRWKLLNTIPGTRDFHFFMQSPRSGYIYTAYSSRFD